MLEGVSQLISSTLSVSPLRCFGADCIYNVLSHIYVVWISWPVKDSQYSYHWNMQTYSISVAVLSSFIVWQAVCQISNLVPELDEALLTNELKRDCAPLCSILCTTSRTVIRTE